MNTEQEKFEPHKSIPPGAIPSQVEYNSSFYFPKPSFVARVMQRNIQVNTNHSTLEQNTSNS